MKFNDLDGNGVQDAGEPGIADWEIVLTSEDGTELFDNRYKWELQDY